MNDMQRIKGRNYGALLFVLAAAFAVFNQMRGTGLGMAGYFFTSLIAYPGLLFLMGREAREKRGDPAAIRDLGLGLFALGFLQKVLLYWVETLLGRAPAFYPFSTAGVPWLFLVGGMGTILLSFYRKRRWEALILPFTVLVGLGVGLVKFIGDFMCLSRLTVFLPFLLLGFLLEEERLEKWTSGLWVKVLGLVSVAGWAVCCLLARKELSALRPLVDGNKWYKDWEGLPRILMGIPARLGFYLAAVLLILGLWALMPRKGLPLLTGWGERWKSGYFWFAPCAHLVSAAAKAGEGTGLGGLVPAGLLALGLLLLAPSRWMNKFPDLVVNWARHTEPRPRTSGELAGGKGLKKYRWGLQLVAMFTVCFLIGTIGYLYPYFSNGKTIIWQVDGLFQQYTSILYTKNYLLGVWENLLETGALHFPQWDFSIGFGLSPSDVLRREPMSLLSLFATEENLEVFYQFMVILRMYLCGLTFLWYCWELGKRERLPMVMGAMVFVFSDFPILAAYRQPFFLTTLLTYFLLTLIGVEWTLQKGRPAVFVAVIALQFLNGYYATYITSLLMALYLLLRLFGLYGRDIKTIAVKIFKQIGWYVWGMAMSMATLLPVLLSFLNSSRSGGKVEIDLFYTRGYYEDLFSELMMGYGGLGYRSYVGVAAIGVVACILLFLKRRKELLPLKLGLCAVTVFICLPIFGSVFNGFDYVTNRWCFAIPFVVAVILVELAPDLLKLTKREKVYLTLAVLVYGALVLTRNEALKDGAYIGVALLAMTTILVLMVKDYFPSRRAQMGALAVATVLNVTFLTAASGHPDFGAYLTQSVDLGESYHRIVYYMDDTVDLLKEREGEDSVYRLGRPFSKSNQSLMGGYYGVSSYYSVIPAPITDYCIDVGLNSLYQTFMVGGLDERAVPSTLASMKYYVTNDPDMKPYGFTEVETFDSVDGEGQPTVAHLYENDYALPLGYTYTTYVTRAEYEEMTALEKQQVMLYGALLEEETDLLQRQEEWYREEKLPVTIAKARDVAIDQEAGTLSVKAQGALTMNFEGKPNSEYYLVLKGLEDQDKAATTSATLHVNLDGELKEASFRSPGQTYYFHRDYLTFHMGYHEEALDKIVLVFSKTMELEYEDIYVVCVPMEDYGTHMEELGQVVLENIEESGDRVKGTISLEENRLLVLSVPWAEGWKAYVNGREQEILLANGMYCGLLLEPGDYEIELRFELPGARTGALISLAAIAAILPVGGFFLRRRKKLNRDPN